MPVIRGASIGISGLPVSQSCNDLYDLSFQFFEGLLTKALHTRRHENNYLEV